MAAALPLLILAACPISMLFMMRGMQGDQRVAVAAPMARDAGAQPTREARLAELQAQQAAIAREVQALEAPNGPTVRQAEAVAHAADERARGAS